MRKAGSDFIFYYEVLAYVEADRYREKSINEYDPACIAAQPEDLVYTVRDDVAKAMVSALQGGRERSSREET